MLKIKQKNCKFKVDRDKQTVVCWVEGQAVHSMVDDFMREHGIDLTAMSSGKRGHAARAAFALQMPWRVTGVATCYADDTWNEELGKMIAFNKMKKKLITLFFKHLQSSIDYIAERVQTMSNAADAFGMRFEAELSRRNAAIEAQMQPKN